MNEPRKTFLPSLIAKLETEITRTDMSERKLLELLNRIKCVDAAPRPEVPIYNLPTIEEQLRHATEWLKRVNDLLVARLTELENIV
jgi:hypothetical protein